jgi:class 3 adenylate cyclase/tetratricopeptide (TPR) repeat protein
VDIGVWLHQVGLPQYEALFLERAVEFDMLPHISEADLEELGIRLGHRKKIIAAISRLTSDVVEARAGAQPPSVTPPSASADRQAHPERRQLTVMVVDLVDSTSLTRRIDPEEMSEVLAAFQNAAGREIDRYGGYIAKYMGDGLRAYFGWPTAHENDAERAVRAGLAIAEAVGRLKAPTKEALSARIGISTGLVVVGELVGQGLAREQTVSGEPPHLAARLQALAPAGGVVVSAATRCLLGSIFGLEDLGTHRLKGFSEPMPVFLIRGPRLLATRFDAHVTQLLPMVGRRKELAVLLDRLQRAQGGQGQVVLLSGEAGVGKSRLLRALTDHVASGSEPGFSTVWYQCSSCFGDTAFHPFIDQIERDAGFLREEPPASRLARLEGYLAAGGVDDYRTVAFIATLLSLPPGGRFTPPELSPQKLKKETILALVEQGTHHTRGMPRLLLFEDAHWADPTSLEVLDRIVDCLAAQPTLLIVTCRPEFAPPSWHERPYVTSLTLRRLSRRQSRTLVNRLSGGRRLPADTVEEIVSKADGVALFLEESIKAILESGLLMQEEGSNEPTCVIPSTLHDALTARLDRLASTKETAQLAAVIGREFSWELLAAVSTLHASVLREQMTQLVSSGLISVRGTPPNATYSFKHALVHDAAYESLLKSHRVRFHAAIARAMEADWPDLRRTRPELLALHYARAGLTAEAVDYGLLAARLAAKRSAYVEALAHLKRALALARSLPKGRPRRRRRLALKMELADVLMAWKGFSVPEVGKAYDDALNACGKVARAEQQLTILWGLFFFHLVRAEYLKCLRIGRKVLRLASSSGDEQAFVAAHLIAGRSLLQVGKLTVARMHFEKASSCSDPAVHRPAHSSLPDPHLVMLTYTALALALLGDRRRASIFDAAALHRARTSRHPHRITFVLLYSIRLHYILSDYQKLHRRIVILSRIVDKNGYELYRAVAKTWESWLLAREGQPAKGITLIKPALESYKSAGATWNVPVVLIQLAEMFRFYGDDRKRLQFLDEALGWIERTGSKWLEAEALRLKGEAHATLGQTLQAERAICESLATARMQRAGLWEARTQASLAQFRLSKR